MTLLEVEELKVYYDTRWGVLKSVDGVSFEVEEKEIFGIAGESGCGKSTLVEGILNLTVPPGRIAGGRVLFKGRNLFEMDESEMRRLRWKEISYIPQSSMNSLNPVMRIEDQVFDVMREHAGTYKREKGMRVSELLRQVHLPREVNRMYSSELSGGMRQRVLISMAMALNPSLVVADEPTTALDMVNGRIILQLISRVRNETKASVILISHDLAAHAEIADKVGIMYAGKFTEIGSVYHIFNDPLHPYTKGLIDSIPSLKRKEVKGIPGESPNPLDWPSGCRFHPRCSKATDICRMEPPEMVKVENGRKIACHLYG